MSFVHVKKSSLHFLYMVKILIVSIAVEMQRIFFYKPEAAVPDIAQFEIKSGDRILLCSDGLYKSMSPEILKARMMDDKTPEEILDVYDFLCEKNGDDNYTAILAIVE